MRILVTGASGFIGAAVAAHLASKGHLIRALCRSSPPASAGVSDWICGAVTDHQTVWQAVWGCDAVIHTAALYSYARSDAIAMHDVNVEGTRNLCEAALGAGVERLLVTSSSATCGPVPGRLATEADSPPEWELSVPYKRTKLEAELAALAFADRGLDVLCVNPTTVVGAGDRRPTPSGKMIRDLVEGKMKGFVRGAGINVVGVRDVAVGHALALERGETGERYILGGENLALADVFARVSAVVGRRAPSIGLPWSVPYSLAWCGERVGRTLGREPELLVLDEVKLARHPLFFSSAKATDHLGYSPRPAAEALTDAARWFAARVGFAPRSRLSWRIRSAASGRSSIRSGTGGS